MRYLIVLAFPIILQNISAQTVDSVVMKQVDSLIHISNDFLTNRYFDQALEVNAIAEKIALDKSGNSSTMYADICFMKGRIFDYQTNFSEAEKWYLESKNIREKVLGKEHPDYAMTLNNLGSLYLQMGKYDKAEPFFLEAKSIREKVLGKQHVDYAESLNNLAIVYVEIGKYDKTELLYLEAKSIWENALGKEHPDYAMSLHNLASLYLSTGKYEKAEPYFHAAKAVWEKALGKEHPDFATLLNNLAILYKLMGNDHKSELYYLESKFISEKVLGKEHPDYAICLLNLASLYVSLGNYEKAELLYNEAIVIWEKTLGKEHPYYAMSLDNLASLYVKMESYHKAEQLQKDAQAIMEKVSGKDHPEYAKILHNLAVLYKKLGKFEKAELLYLEAKSILEKALGRENLDYAESLNDLAIFYKEVGNYKKADTFYLELSNLNQTLNVKAQLHLSEPELNMYLNKFSACQHQILSLAQVYKSEMLLHSSYNTILFYKGFLLSAANQIKQLAISNPTTMEQFKLLKSYKRRLATQYSLPIHERDADWIAEFEDKANRLEKDITLHVAGFGEAQRQVRWEEVRGALHTGEAAIEFIHYPYYNNEETDTIQYAALLLQHGGKQPEYIPLFKEKVLDSLLNFKTDRKADYVNGIYTISNRGAVDMESVKRSLYDIVWKPLEKHVEGNTSIYFSPSGLLHRINLNAIPISEWETLADKYRMIEINSTRQLVLPTNIKNENKDALLFGGIQFEQDSLFQSEEPLLASRSISEMLFSSIDSTLRGGRWNYLPGTEREVNSIEKIMQTSGIKVSLKKGYEATEESFKSIGINTNSSPRILHIATHGYFFTDPIVSNKSLSYTEPVFKISDHPMLRSGLIMAGGNAAWQGKHTPEGREDGILTAYEISQMNLSNTELVVLSACETGLGDIQGNEGVYGLQRAFKIAGAKYLIMSLWQVPDKQTSLLMTTFYKKWLENKMTISNAFHAAQKELRDLGLDPYQWAGFVLVE